MTNVFPVLSRSFHVKDGRAQDLQDTALRYLLAIGLPVTVGLAAAADSIIDTFYGDDFGNAITLLRILSVNVILFCITAVLWRVLAARGEQGAVFRVQTVTATARVTVGTLLIWAFLALGAALNAVGGLGLHAVLLARNVRRRGAIGLVRLCWRFAIAAGVMGMVVLGLVRVVDLWALVPIAMAVYVVLLVVCRAFTSQEIAFVRTLLPSARPQRT
jgi:O-antigen/teichoic acid export membrane protein